LNTFVNFVNNYETIIKDVFSSKNAFLTFYIWVQSFLHLWYYIACHAILANVITTCKSFTTSDNHINYIQTGTSSYSVQSVYSDLE